MYTFCIWGFYFKFCGECMNAKKYQKEVKISLDELALLCLSVDYKIKSQTKAAVEDLSVEIQKKHKFNTHDYRMMLSKYLKGAI